MTVTASTPIPVSILTGFLGAGKTTLLNRLLQDDDLADAAVIVNEFGEIGLDHLLVERADDNVFEMASGCLCCTIRGDLVETMLSLFDRQDAGDIKPFNRILIETTGLADPAPVLHTVMNHPYLLQRCRLEGVITVVDAVNGAATLDAHEESVKQAAMADRLVLSKADLLTGRAGEDQLHAIILRLHRLNPGARILETTSGEAGPANLFNCGLYDPATKALNVQNWLRDEAYDPAKPQRRRRRGTSARDQLKPDHDHHGHHDHHDHHDHDVNRHDQRIRAFAIANDTPITSWGLELFLELLRSYHGPNLLRVKGIIKRDENPEKPLVIHGVQHIFHPPAELDAWPDDDHRSRLVFIMRDVERDELDALFKAFTDPVRGGAEAFRDDTLSLRRDNSNY